MEEPLSEEEIKEMQKKFYEEQERKIREEHERKVRLEEQRRAWVSVPNVPMFQIIVLTISLIISRNKLKWNEFRYLKFLNVNA